MYNAISRNLPNEIPYATISRSLDSSSRPSKQLPFIKLGTRAHDPSATFTSVICVWFLAQPDTYSPSRPFRRKRVSVGLFCRARRERPRKKRERGTGVERRRNLSRAASTPRYRSPTVNFSSSYETIGTTDMRLPR